MNSSSFVPWAPPCPGRILQEQLQTRGWNAKQLAVSLLLPDEIMVAFLAGERRLPSAKIFALAKLLDSEPDFWLNLQSAWDDWQRACRAEKESI